MVAEHEGGVVKPSSLSAFAAAEAIAKENSISVLLGGSGETLQKAAAHAASSHPLISEVPALSLFLLNFLLLTPCVSLSSQKA